MLNQNLLPSPFTTLSQGGLERIMGPGQTTKLLALLCDIFTRDIECSARSGGQWATSKDAPSRACIRLNVAAGIAGAFQPNIVCRA